MFTRANAKLFTCTTYAHLLHLQSSRSKIFLRKKGRNKFLIILKGDAYASRIAVDAFISQVQALII